MILTTKEFNTTQNEILSFIPLRLCSFLYALVNSRTEEIRLRAGRPLILRENSKNYFVTSSAKLSKMPYNAVIVTNKDIENAASLLCNSSVYAYEEEIKNGYITTPFGHRIGLCGDAVIKCGKISFINNISGLNYRIAHEIKGCAEAVINDICCNCEVRDTLIISPPGSGKTTLLRDLARLVSNMGKNVSILDERGEIAAMKNGYPGFDIGAFSDVLQGCKKPDGIPLLVRSMAPEVIITDELSGKEDMLAIRDAKSRGVSIIATIHAKSVKDVDKKLLENFSCIITLSSRLGAGTIEEIMIR